jgi:hypothetical protein
MLIDPNTSCPCNSGQKADACCFSSQPPVIATGARITSATIDASLRNQYKRFNIPPGLNIQVTLNQPYQLDTVLENRLKAFMDIFTPPADYDEIQAFNWIKERGSAVEQLSDSLYAVRYHQKQFLFRLSRVYSEQLFAFEPPKGNVSIVINDRPLKAELEAFLFRVTSSLDSLAKTISVARDIKPLKFGELIAKINRMPNPLKNWSDLKKIITNAEKWIVPLKEFRNAIAHDGDCKGFIGVSHKGMLVNDAQIGGVPAGKYVINTWTNLLCTVDEVIRNQKAPFDNSTYG